MHRHCVAVFHGSCLGPNWAKIKIIGTKCNTYQPIRANMTCVAQRYDTIRYNSVYLTCSKKLTGSQLSLPHGMNKKLKRETKNKLMKPTRKAFRTWFRRFVDCSHCLHLEVPQQHLHILRMHPHRKLPSLQQNSRRLICKKILANNTINKCVSKTHSAIPGEGVQLKLCETSRPISTGNISVADCMPLIYSKRLKLSRGSSAGGV